MFKDFEKPEPQHNLLRWELVKECQHETILCRRVFKNGQQSFEAICKACGITIKVYKHVALTKEQRENAYPVNEQRLQELKTAWSAKQYSEWQEQRSQAQRRENEAWWLWYNQYLASPEWEARRQAVLRRDKHTCQGCGESSAFQVHHLTYEHVGREFLFELVALCEVCHKKVHKDQRRGYDRGSETRTY